MYKYDPQFYRYINRSSLSSAAVLVPAVRATLPQPPSSVLDVGCGVGAWLSVWKAHETAVCGIDGDYVDSAQLLIEPDEFVAADLGSGFDLGRRFDLVQCLEVAEHLAQASAPLLVAALCRHADVVLFSAAAPGQGGENHINERPYGYWRDLFAGHGYVMYDALRGAVRADAEVAPWYRYNTFLYVGGQAGAAVHAALQAWRVDPASQPADISPLLYRLRKALVRSLPPGAATRLALVKRWLSNAGRRQAAP